MQTGFHPLFLEPMALPTPDQVSTGIAGLDHLLNGGLPAHEIYLIAGDAGTGKTTVALQFLLAGIKAGERCLYLTLSETAEGLRKIARSHGWSLDGIELHEMASFSPSEQAATEQTVFVSAEVELNETTAEVFKVIERVKPARLVFDSVAQVRALASDPLHFQRQLFAMRHQFAKLKCTVLLVDSSDEQSGGVEDLCHGAIRVKRDAADYGNVRRRLIIEKMRGLAVHGGYHNFKIRTGGLQVFPRLVVGEGSAADPLPPLPSGIEALDAMIGGGLEQGTAVLVQGATGTGKTTLSTLYVHAAAKRGEHAAIFLFEERLDTFFKRSAGLSMDLKPFVEQKLVAVHQVNAGDLSPGEFSDLVRRAVEEEGARVVMIDSVSGYFHSVPQEQLLITQIHELLSFLTGRGVLTLLIAGEHGIAGHGVTGPLEVSYLCDTLLLLRHFDAAGEIRKTIAVIKKRHGAHEHTIRELRIDPSGLRVGEPLEHFDGLLTGTPVYHGDTGSLLGRNTGE